MNKVAGATNNNGKGGRQPAPVDVGSPLLDWEEGDHFSFEDSERFEEDSLCSWSSEPESLCNNWRGWKRPILQSTFGNRSVKKTVQDKTVSTLSELAAKCVACHIPFELVEHVYPPVPEQLQLQIAFWSFPDSEDDIRLYSCLANGSADEFQRGEHLFRDRAVKDVLQIGFHLSATVVLSMPRAQYNVAVTFDRQRISSCNCTCSSSAHWCSHIVAVCLYRIHLPTQVCLRAPVSESLQRLRRDQLQKFAQYLISELPRQVLPTAQRILDELLSAQPNQINATCGAPDPTAGASAYEYTSWFLDEKTLHNNINKILVKFCVPAPIVFSDVNYLSTSAPPAAAEWSSLLRPLRGREPEGMWNLLSIVREMFKRNDRNAIPLLEIITEEVMACEQIIVWWYSTKAALVAWGGGTGGGKHGGGGGNSAAQHACSSLCDEVVVLWRLAALNPALAPHERDMLHEQFAQWHMKVLDKVAKNRNNHMGTSSHPRHSRAHTHSPYINGISENEVFPGFHPAMEACFLEWDDYQIPGVTYTKDLNPLYHSPFTIFRHSDKQNENVHQVISSKAVLNNEMSLSFRLTNQDPSMHGHRTLVHRTSRINVDLAIAGPSNQPSCSGDRPGETTRDSGPSDGNHSSVSSEGFCENEEEILQQSGGDTDSHASSSPPVSSDDARRRISNDESVSDDECQMYYYDAAAARRVTSEGTGSSVPVHSASSSNMNTGWVCGWEVSFARAEGLQAHGHAREACALGASLARELLARPPALCFGSGMSASSAAAAAAEARRARRRHLPSPRLCAASHRLSCLASATLAKCAFLCTVLAEFSEHHELAFRVGLYALEMARPPASTKALEVKLNNQETELVALLKRLPTGVEQLALAREKAEQLRDGTLRNRGPALLPIALATFLFEVLVLSATDKENKHAARLPSDEALGFEAAVAALGLKANVSEAEHPLLCEGTRRQRGELALTMLSFYKDDPVKLARIMNKLLDRDIHQLTKGPMASMFYTNNPRIYTYRADMGVVDHYAPHVSHANNASHGSHSVHSSHPGHAAHAPHVSLPQHATHGECLAHSSHTPHAEFVAQAHHAILAQRAVQAQYAHVPHAHVQHSAQLAHPTHGAHPAHQPIATLPHGNHTALVPFMPQLPTGGTLVSDLERMILTDGSSQSGIQLSAPQHSQHPQIAQHSQLVQHPQHPQHPQHLQHSQHAQHSQHQQHPQHQHHQHQHQQHQQHLQHQHQQHQQHQQHPQHSQNPQHPQITQIPQSSQHTQVGQHSQHTQHPPLTRPKDSRYKGKRVYPSVPNQPSEAFAHFMFELAKSVLFKAGGSSSTSLFTQTTCAREPQGPHRGLHMAAFQLGLYALGLHNCVSANWLSRTYSSHVSWITGQAMDIGAPAILFLIDAWEGHLTPPEAAGIADKASSGRDAHIVHAAAELALSVLPHAHALNYNEIQRAVLQCKEQSDVMLERACLTVEAAAKGGGVYPEVLYTVARYWHELYLRQGTDEEIAEEPQQRVQPPVPLPVPYALPYSFTYHPYPPQIYQLQYGGAPAAHPAPPYALPQYFVRGIVAPSPHAGHATLPQHPQHVSHAPLPAHASHSAHPSISAHPPLPALPPLPAHQTLSASIAVNHPVPIPPPMPATHNTVTVGTVTSVGTSVNGVGSMGNIGNIGSLGNIGNVGSIGNVGNIGNVVSIGNVNMSNVVNVGNTGNVGTVTNMVNASTMANVPNVGAVGNVTNMANVGNIGNVSSVGNVGNIGNVSNMGNVSNIGSVGNVTNMANMGNMTNMGNVSNMGNITNMSNLTNMSNVNNMGNVNVGSVGNLTNVANMGNMATVGSVTNLGSANNVNSVTGLPPTPGPPSLSQAQSRRLLAAYRVGMLALETQARRVHDDRPQNKFGRNPPYGEHVKWLLRISKRLGAQYLHQFCLCAVNSVVSPFVLYELCVESAHWLARGGPHQLVMQHLRGTLAPLVQKCQQMYIQCIHQKLYHLTTVEYEDFVGIVLSARTAFQLTPEGNTQFKEWLASLRRSKSCKKDLWTQLNAALQTNGK